MESIDTLITARWVVPIEPDSRVLEHHAVAVHRGSIVAIVPAREAQQRFAAEEVVARPNHVLLPGFVNAHTRAAMTLLRGATRQVSRSHQPARSKGRHRTWGTQRGTGS